MIHHFFRRPDYGRFSDEELQIAARAVRDSMLRSLEEDSGRICVFSNSFLSRMEALFRLDARRSSFRRALQHAAIIVIGVFLAGALLLAFNPEARAEVARWIRNTYEKSIFYQFFSEENSDGQEESSISLPDVEFNWLPEDYEIQKVYDDGLHIVLSLENDDIAIILDYWTTESIKYTEIFMDEFLRQDVSVWGRPADFYQALDANTASILIWTDDDEQIVYFLNAPLPKDTIIQIAENITEIKK